MKKTIAFGLLLALLLCLAPAGFAEGESFAALSGLDTIRAALDEGVTIESVYYTDGYGFSTSEFTTTDPDEIEALLDALGDIELGEKSNMSITDWYPQIVFRFSDGTRFGIRFEAHWLSVGSENYELRYDNTFWLLTSVLVQQYESRPAPVGPSGEPPEQPEFIPNCIDLYFPTNPTTGYAWSVEIEDGGIVESREQVFEDSHELGFTGAGGTHWFHLDGVGEGMTSVIYRYARPWEESALYTFTYRVRVDEDRNVFVWGVEMTTD